MNLFARLRKSWRIKSCLLIFFLFCCAFSTLSAWSGQIQFSPYLDSNVGESLTKKPDPTYGLKLRGGVNGQVSRSQWRLHTDLLAQTFLDGKFKEESKWVANMESGFQYALLRKLYLTGQLTHFQKMFYSQERSYRWTEYSTHLQVSPAGNLMIWIGYVLKSTVFRTGETIRFYERNREIRGRYTFNPWLYLEGVATSGSIGYKNFGAWGVEDVTSLVPLDFDQKDKFTRGLIHLRYQGKAICGIQVGFESVNSNSIIGKFDLVIFRVYLTARLGKSNFSHFVLQRVDKDYQYPAIEGISDFRDPEERIQNRTYLQLERELREGTMGFIQFSLLKNETILNQKYYDKTMVEFGIKYEL